MPTLTLSYLSNSNPRVAIPTDDPPKPPSPYEFIKTNASLLPQDTNGGDDLYARNIATGDYTLVSSNSDGTTLDVGGGIDGGFSFSLLSPDATKVAFSNATFDYGAVYVKDLVTGGLVRFDAGYGAVEFSQDLSHIVYRYSYSVGGDRYHELYVGDLATASSVRVNSSYARNDAHLSADGRYVAYATNPGEPDSAAERRDLVTGELVRVLTPEAAVNGFWTVRSAEISPDGNWIAFTSNFYSNQTYRDVQTSLYLKNISTGEITLVASGTPSAFDSGYGQSTVHFSEDGSSLVFNATSGTRVGGEVGSGNYVYDLSPELSLTFTAATDGSTVTFDPGDGSDTATFTPVDGATTVSHKYMTDGVYAATLTASAPGQTDTVTPITVTVRAHAESAVTETGGAGVDMMLLSALNDTASGGAGDDYLRGNAGNDTLNGEAGNDALDGGAGADAMAGGLGNDTYYVDNTGDTVTEGLGAGTDTIVSSISLTLGDNIERLSLTGSAALNGTGNLLGNIITGNDGANTLNGFFGDDYLDGGAGADTLVGGLGNDTFVIDSTADKIVEKAGEGTDTVRSAIGFTLTANVENLILTGTGNVRGNGNDGANTLVGNAGDNTLSGSFGNDALDGGAGDDLLNGGKGADRMLGRAGNDVYYVDNAGDLVIEAVSEGTDSVVASITYTLPTNVENLYLVSAGSLNGTGNTLDNTITGSQDETNVLYGLDGNDTLSDGFFRDVLEGGNGNDTLYYGRRMYGGAGNDIYYVAGNASSLIREAANAGIDQIYANADFTLPDNIENLILTGAARNGTGNTLNNAIAGNAANNTLLGGVGNDILDGKAGNDVLDGGTGNDRLIGGLGDDIYVVNPGDTLVEAANAGTDTIRTAYNFTLAANFENLILLGTGRIQGTGNAVDNVITGNGVDNRLNGLAGNDTLRGGGGNDTLYGGLGTDTLDGGSGADIFRYDSALEGGDVILKFEAGLDKFRFSAAGFSHATGALDAGEFVSGTDVAATAAHAQFLYDTGTGLLFYDADGTGQAEATILAALGNAPILTAADIYFT